MVRYETYFRPAFATFLPFGAALAALALLPFDGLAAFFAFLIAACAAASLAIGTRNGEQET